MDWFILIYEDGVVNLLGRTDDLEIEIIANFRVLGDIIFLDRVHFTKNHGGELKARQLQQYGQVFLRQHGNGATQLIVSPSSRSTGATAGKGIILPSISIILEKL